MEELSGEALRRARSGEATAGEAFGLTACARFLEEVSRCRHRGEEVAAGVLATANEIAEQVLGHSWPPPSA